ncbi:MAG TPA: glycoside hydrolase family 3 N-terminal domain-containing protein [Saprospiraceae bacterium]|nr:glycoside hydrolase family 3 N-terminal domain-containing protein [Saprospiraceae bacterium]
MNRLTFYIGISLINIFSGNLFAQDFEMRKQWVDSIYNVLNDDERIGQLFMQRAFSKKDKAHTDEILKQIEQYKIGGLCFFQGSPAEQARLVNLYQSKSKIPLMIAIDGEWGIGMRFRDEVFSFPRQLTLGAIQNENLIYEMGEHIALQCKEIGVHVNFAPVIDVNNNPQNPVINDRSFGEDIYNVAAKGFAYMKGMQDNGVLACAKHFPGHGDTDTDSHLDLPIVHHDMNRLDSLELMPFKVLIEQGVASIMVAHMHIPSIDDRPNRPTTLSANAITELLRNKLGFNGLIFTDAMEMKGVTNHFSPGIAEAEALLAGNDMIVLSTDIGKAIKTIQEYRQRGLIKEDQIEKSVKRILTAKYDAGLSKGTISLNPDGIEKRLNNPNSRALKSRLFRESVTLVSDSAEWLPIMDIDRHKFATISLGSKGRTFFQNRISDYVEGIHFHYGKTITDEQISHLIQRLKDVTCVIVGIHEMQKLPERNFGITDSQLQLISALRKQNKQVITVLFGSPYALSKFQDVKSLIVAYEEDDIVQDVVAQAIFGAGNFRGRLPVSAGKYTFGTGIMREGIGRLGYDIPESVGLSSDSLAMIDVIMDEMINKKAAPGGQILIAKDGKIVFEKSYGHFTYTHNRPVTKDDIYDLASVTKILTTTISMMKLVDQGKVNIRNKASTYIPQLDTTNKKNIKIDEMMAHYAQLQAWIPFYKSTMDDNKRNPNPLPDYYQRRLNEGFAVPVAENLFMRNDYKDSIWSIIYGSKLRESPGYRYSDLSFFLAQNIIENVGKIRLDQFAEQHFYKPLGLRKTRFNPRDKIPVSMIAPSEEDIYFRRQRIQGHVHDMGAAMMGGVGGHAGLFSNANELAVLMQMLLNNGYYGGKRYIEASTVELFTTRYGKSTRRGIGFDMKELDKSKPMNMSPLASKSAYGHTGFTGTCVYADPAHNIVFVFLSNRTYPRMSNNTLNKYEFRQRVQSVIYQSLEKPVLP